MMLCEAMVHVRARRKDLEKTLSAIQEITGGSPRGMDRICEDFFARQKLRELLGSIEERITELKASEMRALDIHRREAEKAQVTAEEKLQNARLWEKGLLCP